VDCSEALQIRRLQARDGATLDQAHQILSAQATREARIAAANDVILNEGDLGVVRDRVAELHGLYLKLATDFTRQAPT
jgi:dephospho-CoA kinase